MALKSLAGEDDVSARLSSMGELRAPEIPDKSAAAKLPPRVKLRAIVGIERAIAPLFFVGFFTFGIGLMLGPGRKSFGVIGAGISNAIAFGLGGLLVFSALMIWLMFDNYYLLDCAARSIWVHKGVRFRGAETIFLQAGEVAAIGLNCRERRGRYSQVGWNYTPVLLTKDGSDIKLSTLTTKMDGAQLAEYNGRRRTWAAALGCYWVECPSQQVFRAREQFEAWEKTRCEIERQ